VPLKSFAKAEGEVTNAHTGADKAPYAASLSGFDTEGINLQTPSRVSKKSLFLNARLFRKSNK
jgi:hypothetical protein